MALRVLLADNSETIKKVIQLTLQDFGLDLRIVTLGVDVIDVATQFKPDVIFVDILLQKKSGYDVSREIKTHPQLKSTPVILMWSGFMEFDETKAKESLADARLEKPFEAAHLRQLVQKLVQKTQSNPLGSFLDFPDIPKAEKQQTSPGKKNDPLLELEKIKQESAKFEASKTSATKPPPIPPTVKPTPEPEEFEMKPITLPIDSEAEETALFKVDIPEDGGIDEIPVEIDQIDPIEDMSFLLNPEEAKKVKPQNVQPVIPTPPPTPQSTVQQTAVAQPIIPDQKLIEKMVHDKIHELVEKIAWQLVPEVASQLIKKELERLLKENDAQP